MSQLRLPCPRCGREITVDESVPLPRDFPFCSDRCRLSDLGKWFDEEYRIAGRPAPPPDSEPRRDTE